MSLGLRFAAVGVLALLAIVAMIWPFGWPKNPRSRSQLAYSASTFCAVGILMFVPFSHGPNVTFFAMVAFFAWVALGILWITRRNPKIPNPDWLRQPWSVADWGLITIVVLAAIAAAVS